MDDLLLHLGLFCILLGFLTRDQILLRTFVVLGQTLFAVNYFVHDTSLFSPMFWHVLFVVINAVIITQIYFERKTFKFTERQKILYSHFNNLNPGEFRKLLKITNWQTVKRKKKITRLNKKLNNLFFIIDGYVEVQKDEKIIKLKGPVFIGELAFLSKSNASADVTVLSKSNLVYWKNNELNKLLSTRPSMKISLNNLINKDLVKKLSN